ncbi:MAG: polysaccharide deacetylase family protein [Lentisphaeria bacterium]|nr:polysaccharide deacetylase family protein [Lentisphaeria bacterium]
MKNRLFTMTATVACAALVNANPLGLRSYEQRFTMTFATQEEARAAKVALMPLPDGCELAFSARWDDTTVAHRRTHEVMKRNDIKGTFFENSPRWFKEDEREEHYRILREGGCSFGVHTMTHPFMNLRDANTIFWEYMRSRVLVETGTHSQATTTVMPYTRWNNSADAQTALDIGRAIQATGLIGSPDVFCPYGEAELGLAKNTLAMGFLLRPGDTDPDYDLAQTQLSGYLENPVLKDNPDISMSMHSWHTDDGLVTLDRIFASMAHNPKWWYCNQNEYAAYRYEFRHDQVEKFVQGNTATFVVTRVSPAELGASVPLSLQLTGAAPTALSGIEKTGDFYRLPHAAEFGCPVVFGLADEDGKCTEIPGVTAKLAHAEKGVWTLTLENSGAALENVDVIFRFGPAWEHLTLRGHQNTVADGAVFTAVQEHRREGKGYQWGAPYYVAQIDFVQDGVHKRLYAELQESAEPIVRTACPRDLARAWDATNVADFAKLSVAGAALPAQPEQKVFRDGYRPDVMWIAAGEPGDAWSSFTAYVLDFQTANDATKALLCFSVPKEVWLNGRLLDLKQKEALEVDLQPGVNRVVLVHKRPYDAFFAVLDPATRQNIAEFVQPR